MKLKNMKKKSRTKEIRCEGSINNLGTEDNPKRLSSNINYSAILSRLIVESGKICKSYASDLFITWETMLTDVSKVETDKRLTYYFGFRSMGVDHEKFIQARLDSPGVYGEKPFKSIFRLDVTVDINRKNLIMELIQVL